ncbi:MAG: ORF6N domain-containing protein [Burkholderiales bacterium]|nr:ORF6N domain-containing protein [Burkholderiales bacterium]
MKDRGINKKHEAQALVVTAQIARQILVIRGQKVILDADLAVLYGVQTRRLNEQVRRNAERFPEDFVFQTSPTEFASLKSQFATSSWGGTRKLPLAFTEHGAIMAAMVLNSPRATEVSVYVVRAFVQLRDALLTHKELAKRLDELESRLERKLATHDQAITGILEAIRQLMAPPEPMKKRRIGFVQSD